MKRIKLLKSISYEVLRCCWGKVECVLILVLFASLLTFTFHAMDSGLLLEPLLLPFALVIAVGAGLRLRTPGAVAISALSLLVVGYSWLTKLGPFASGTLAEHLLFALALVALIASISLFSALVVGYHLRTVEILDGREHLMHRILNALPIGVWVCDREGRTVFMNERWASFSPLSAEEAMGSSSKVSPIDLGETWEADRQALFSSADEPIQCRYLELLAPNGERSELVLLSLRVYIDEMEDVGTLSLLVDETALRLHEEAVRVGEHRLRMALDTAEMGFWEHDFVSGETFRDANWFRILGAEESAEFHNPGSPEEWLGCIHGDDRERVLSAYADFLDDSATVMEIDYRILQGGVDSVWVQARLSAQRRDADERTTRIMGTIQNISARKRIELDLKDARDRAEAASQAKGHFIATISHEIRTPLNAIIGLSSFLNESELDDEQLDLSQTIYSSGKSLLLLVNDILDFSKIEAGHVELEMQEFPLRACFEDSVKLFQVKAAERDVSLRLTLGDSLSEFALGDMERLRQIVQNLLSNALKFTNEGEVEVVVRTVDCSELPFGRRPLEVESIGYLDELDYDYLEVLVRDSGIGIPLSRQGGLFEAFSQVDASTTRKYGGTGLGLAICQRLVDAMGGQIWLESREGVGSVFGFVVRTKLIGDVPGSPVVAERVERIVDQYPCDILIVGESEEAASLLRACRQLGYAPHHTSDYDLSTNAFESGRYDVVLICMSKTVAALELSREITTSSGARRTQLIVGVVPDGQRLSKVRCKLVGMQHLIDGEINASTMRALIQNVPNMRD